MSHCLNSNWVTEYKLNTLWTATPIQSDCPVHLQPFWFNNDFSSLFFDWKSNINSEGYKKKDATVEPKQISGVSNTFGVSIILFCIHDKSAFIEEKKKNINLKKKEHGDFQLLTGCV